MKSNLNISVLFDVTVTNAEQEDNLWFYSLWSNKKWPSINLGSRNELFTFGHLRFSLGRNKHFPRHHITRLFFISLATSAIEFNNDQVFIRGRNAWQGKCCCQLCSIDCVGSKSPIMIARTHPFSKMVKAVSISDNNISAANFTNELKKLWQSL